MWRKLTVDWLQAKIFCQKYFVDSWCQTVHPDGCLWKLFHLPAIIADHYLFIFSGFFPWICVACGRVCSILQYSQVFWVYHSVWVSLQKLPIQDEFDSSFFSNAVPRLKVTEFRSNTDYSIYVLGSNFIFMGEKIQNKLLSGEWIFNLNLTTF